MGNFSEYVKRYADSRGVSVEDALKHQIIKDAKEYFENSESFEEQINQEIEETFNEQAKRTL